MKENKKKNLFRTIFLGNRYSEFTEINEQIRYMTMNSIFIIVIFPLVILGITIIDVDFLRAVIDFSIALLCFISLILIRTRVPLKFVPIVPVIIFGGYCLYLLYLGDLNLWAAVWIFAFPPISIFLCGMMLGVIESVIILIGTGLLMYTPLAQIIPDNDVRIRILGAYILIFGLSVVYEWISVLKDRKENEFKAELSNERDMIQTMKDNIHQGIFLMDKELRILSQYSRPLVSILSYYEEDLTGKYFLDIISPSFDTKQLQFMKGYFGMIFEKSKSTKVLDLANPIAEFEYKINDQIKTLSTKFSLIEQAEAEPVIIAIIQDITREKEFERELQTQREVQELEMKNMFDVLQVDPLVFQNFIEDSEANFNLINDVLKSQELSEKQVVIKIFQTIHSIKADAGILGLEYLSKKLHTLEDEIKTVNAKDTISVSDVLSLSIKIENLRGEMDSYTTITSKISAHKNTSQLDEVLVKSISRAAQRLSNEIQKKVDVKAGQIDLNILESKLRKPIKEILYQCVRNSIYHGIEQPEERLRKKKNIHGLLTFSIKNVGGKAEVIFSDDGSGLDWEKIKSKYLAEHPQAQTVDKNVLLKSIFAPGFSTSEEAGSMAGRGVGLSLVMDLVKENHGSLNVNSPENGLTFKFTFPLTA